MIEFFPGTIRPESSFSKTFLERGKNPKRRGAFFEGDAHGRTLVIATFKTVKLYCLVDFQSNRVYDTRFFSYGDSLSVVISDGIAELIIGKSIEECSKVTVKEVEKLFRDEDGMLSIPENLYGRFSFVSPLLMDLKSKYPSAKQEYIAKSKLLEKAKDFVSLEEEDKIWQQTAIIEKQLKIEDALDKHVRKGLEADGGGIQVLSLDGFNLRVKYEGNCGSCAASSGGTLYYIEDALRKHVYGRINVIPIEDLDDKSQPKQAIV